MDTWKKINCPFCGHEVIDVETIIPEDDYAFCTVCQKEFKLSDIFTVPDSDIQNQVISEEMIHTPPRGAWIYEDFDKTVIGASDCNVPVFIMLLIPLGLFSFALITIISGIASVDGYSVVIFLLFIWIIIFDVELHLLFGKEGIVINKDKKDAYYYYGFKKNGTTKKEKRILFDKNAVERIYERTLKMRNSSREKGPSVKIEKFIMIKVKEKTIKEPDGRLTDEISLGGNFTPKQRKFVLDTLGYFFLGKEIKGNAAHLPPERKGMS